MKQVSIDTVIGDLQHIKNEILAVIEARQRFVEPLVEQAYINTDDVSNVDEVIDTKITFTEEQIGLLEMLNEEVDKIIDKYNNL